MARNRKVGAMNRLALDTTPGEKFPGWYLLGQYESGVGSWLLYHGGEALLLEVPESTRNRRLVMDAALYQRILCLELKYITASHSHEDHLCEETWKKLQHVFPAACALHPNTRLHYVDCCCYLGGERLHILPAPKHSMTDAVIVFRGVAMTGDIETGMLASVNNEVPEYYRRRSMDWLRGFQQRCNYYVHTTVSAHLNSLKTNVDWEQLFSYEQSTTARQAM